MNCPSCSSTKLYTLKNSYIKCPKCKKKYSLKKLLFDKKIIMFFCLNIPAYEASKKLNVNYRSIKNRYDLFRKLLCIYLDDLYTDSKHEKSEYEEFYYFSKRAKNSKNTFINQAVNIIGFYSNNKIFTLLLPKLTKYENINEAKNYEKYLSWHKINSRTSYKTPLSIFWTFLEGSLKKYKGVKEENFFLYLKEAEFKFNYLHNEQNEILNQLYFNK